MFIPRLDVHPPLRLCRVPFFDKKDVHPFAFARRVQKSGCPRQSHLLCRPLRHSRVRRSFFEKKRRMTSLIAWTLSWQRLCLKKKKKGGSTSPRLPGRSSPAWTLSRRIDLTKSNRKAGAKKRFNFVKSIRTAFF